MIDLTALTLALWLAAVPVCPRYALDRRLEASPDRRDPAVYRSPPDSAHLEAHKTWNTYVRFPEVKVDPGRVYRLRFWYLTAAGTTGAVSARLSQYEDTPGSWKALGYAEIPLAAVGRWAAVDALIPVNARATTAALEVKVESPDGVGEVWVDSVSFAPKGEPILRGP